jgi:hypothetical protein
MPRGGKRTGAPGKAYGNRSDLNTNRTLPVQTAPNQPYGVAGQQADAQRAIPLRPQPSPTGGAPVSGAPTAGPVPQTPVVPLTAPTTRPDEPLTAGVDIGPGPGAPPMSQPAADPLIEELRAVYLAYPNEDLRELLEDYDTGRSF